MARATRSTASVQQPQPPIQRKRKRNSSPQIPLSKHQKTLDSSDDIHLIQLSQGDVAPGIFLNSDDAQKILNILEFSDTQGLLDRVFPLHTAPDSLHSLRALLKQPSKHPLTSIKTAVNHLFPITSLPRSHPSPEASQQLAFSNLALSLVEQASFNTTPVFLDKSSILETTAIDDDVSPKTSPVITKRKYAMVQRLPAGDYWTSISSENASSDIKGLATGHAELVAILPSTSSTSVDTLPTLGSVFARPLGPTKPIQSQRRITTGGFLDYGIFASFAPSFDQNGEMVGQRQLGEVLYQKQTKEREAETKQRELYEGIGTLDDGIMNGDDALKLEANVDEKLEGLLSPEDVASIKVTLEDLQLENAVQELLERNHRALERLEELQRQRLSKGDASFSHVEEGSEEWETAQCIAGSLTALVSLRPRSMNAVPVSLVPSSAVLRKLHRTLALEASPGWYGNLPATRPTALQDDSTINLRAGGVPPPSSSIVPAPTTSASVSQTPASNSYAPYTYNYSATSQQQQAYRPATASYTPYKPGQTASYYQPYIPTTTQQQAYYNQQSYATGTSNQQPYGATSTQQPYAYQGWYGQYPQTTSGRGTPQPTATTSTTYGSFFTAASTTAAVNGSSGARTPAVANTVINTKAAVTGQQGSATAGTWAPSAYQAPGVAPTLPTHLRTAQTPTTATPVAVGSYQPQQPAGYFQTYQVQAQTAAPAR